MAYQGNGFASDDPNVTAKYNYRTAEEYAAYLLPHLKPHFSILDVGSGPGGITRDLAKLVPEGKVTGIDMSPGIVEQARSTYQEPNLSYEVGEATDLAQFGDNSFDVVHAHCVLMHVPNQVKALKEMYRVAKPGGIVASRDPGVGCISIKPDMLPFTRLMSEYQKIQSDFLIALGSCPCAGLHKKKWAVQAGFEEERGGRIWEQKSFERTRHDISLLRGPNRERFVELGLATYEQIDEWTSLWDQWAEHDDREVVREFVDMLYFKGPA